MKKKKINKRFIVYTIMITLYLVSLIFFTKSIISLTGIENLIRYGALVVLYLLLIIYIVLGFNCVSHKKKKRKTFITINILLGLFIPVFILGSYFVDKTYNKINTLNKTTILYTSNLISLNNSEIDNDSSTKFGMINDTTDIEGYILAKKLIKKENINKPEIVYYEDYIEMINDLYNGKLDGIFVSSNYSIMFTEDFETIKDDTKVHYTYSEEREKENDSNSKKKLTEPFTLLLIGVDGTSTALNANQSFNGDTLMVITFNPKNLNITMLSIPRDTYVPIACRGNKEAKINTSAYGGTKCVINTIQNLIDIDIDYYVKINFAGVVSLVEALDGIDVTVPYAMCEQDSLRRFGDDTIYIEEGLQHLNGEQALALSRNRHYWTGYCDPKYTTDGNRNDFTRGQNQQLVVTSIAKEVKNIRSVSEFYRVLDAISSSIDTNITTDQMLSLYEVGKTIITNSVGNSEINIEKTYLTTASQYINNRSMQIYYPESLKEIINAMKENLELQSPSKTTTFSFDANENYEKHVVGKTYNGGVALKNTIPSFVGKTKNDVNNWANENGITVNYETVDASEYSNPYENGYIINQSPRATTLIDEISEITIYVIKNSSIPDDNEPESITPEENIDDNIINILE